MIRSLSIPTIIFFSFLISLSTSISAQKKNDAIAEKIDALFKQYNSTTPGCAIAVVKNGKTIFKKGYGMANLEYNIPITPESIFDIASISKQFAGLAISMLIEQGKIAVTDEIHKYLPELPQFGKTITIDHLIHHTSGIRDWPQTLAVAGWRWDETFSFADIMRMVKHQKDLDFEPGLKYSYSNTGYNLLAVIVEKVSGQSFRAWTDAHIFRLLGMNATHFLDDHRRIIKNLAYSYTPTDSGFIKSPDALTAAGSSSLFTSVDDLCEWLIHFQRSIAKGDPVYKRMLTKGILNNKDTILYAYGLVVDTAHKLKTISHSGSWAGYRTMIKSYPEEKLGVIVLGNVSDFNSYLYTDEVADFFLKSSPLKQDGKIVNIKDAPTVEVAAAVLKKYEGTYQTDDGSSVIVTTEKNKLFVQAEGEPKYPTKAKSDSVFWIPAYGETVIFVSDVNGQVNLIKYMSMDAKRIASNVTPIHSWALSTEQLQQYAGVYYSEELSTEYKVNVENGKLMIYHMRLGDILLSVDSTAKEQFSSSIGNIAFVRDSNGKVTGLRVSGGRIKNIRFDKR